MYKLNNVEVSAEQIQALLKEHPEIMGKKREGPSDGEWYWRISEEGTLLQSIFYIRDAIDSYNWNTNQYFLTREEAEAHKEYLLAVARVTRRVEELNGEWVPVWNSKPENWTIQYCPGDGEFSGTSWAYYMSDCVVPYMKSEFVANTIIKECEKDLKTIFKIK